MPLPSLPFDVLLAVFRDLDAIDVVRTGMTCKELYDIIKDRHIWVDQLEKLRRKDPVLKPATPPLTSLSAHELKTLVTGRVKLRLRWNRGDSESGFAAKGLIGIPGGCEPRLLPGGKSVLLIDACGGVTLRRIVLEDGQVSLPVVANIEYDRRVVAESGWSKLLTAMSPCPILVHRQGNDMHLVRVDNHNSAMSLETTFPIHRKYCFLEAHGQGRVVGLLIQRPFEPPRAIVLHLDYPGVRMESEVPRTYTGGPAGILWNICIPTESLVIVYNTGHILAYEIPHFSSLSFGVNLSSMTPMWYWPGPDVMDQDIRILVSYTTCETLYDPSSAQEFNLHYVCRGRIVEAGPFTVTVTIPINAKDNSTSKSTELPTVKQKSTPAQSHGWSPAGFSCQKGLHSDVTLLDDALDVLITPLDDLGLEGGRGALRILLSYEELGCLPQAIGVDMDEATGRVVIWGLDENLRDTKVFVGDLV